jgi:hypothetical protein
VQDGLTPETMAMTQDKPSVGDLLSSLKSDTQRQAYIDQLTAVDTPLKRIKLKLFGDSAAGKTRLLAALQSSGSGMMGGLFSGLTRRFSDVTAQTSGRGDKSESCAL